jgi:hypothetical protein
MSEKESCGDIAFWRKPDIQGMLERYGQAEHLAVQFDFLCQADRDGRAEFSIPESSASGSGNTGYADIVSVATREIWEIKPENDEKGALKKATRYVEKANVACGGNWKLGTSYTTLRKGVVVYEIPGIGIKAELCAEQRGPGVVVYYWRKNGEKLAVRDPFFAMGTRMDIVDKYFPSPQSVKPLPGKQPPDNLPPIKWKPPILVPGSLMPELAKFAETLMSSILTTCCQRIVDGGKVAILLDPNVYKTLAPRSADRTASLLRVRAPDPTVTLYRETLAAFTAASVAHGAVAAAAAGVWIADEIVAISGAILVRFILAKAPVLAAEAAAASSDLIATFLASVRSSESIRATVTSGAALLGFVIPRASMAAPNKPVSIGISMAKFRILNAKEAKGVRVGESMQANGADWIVVGLAESGPD